MKSLKKFFKPIKDYFGQFKRTEKQESLKLSKKFGTKKHMKWIIWGVLVLFLFMMILAIYKANVAYQAYKDNGDVESKFKTAQAEQMKSLKNDPKTKTFTEQYLNEYMEIPESDDARAEREEKLQDMSGKDMEFDELKWDGKRTLNSMQFFDSEMKGDVLINKYIVDYSSKSVEEKPKEVEKEVKDGKKKKKVKETKNVKEEKENDNKMLVNVSIKGGDGQYKVVETPYFTSIPNMNDKQLNATKNSMEDETSINNEELKKFTEQFFKDYTTKSTDEMKYQMEHPESVKGAMEYDNMKAMDIYKKKGEYVVKATVMLNDKGVKNPHEENFTLNIVKDSDNNYKVKKLTHSLGKDD